LRTSAPTSLRPAGHYRDYIAWLARRDRAGEERFWRQRLSGLTDPTPLPFAASRRRQEPSGFREQEHSLSNHESATLDAFARDHKTTRSSIIQAAWALLLGS